MWDKEPKRSGSCRCKWPSARNALFREHCVTFLKQKSERSYRRLPTSLLVPGYFEAKKIQRMKSLVTILSKCEC